MFAQTPAVEWSKIFGGSGQDLGSDINMTSDGGYIAAVLCWSNDGDGLGNQGINDFLIIKLDQSGNVEWKNLYGGSSDDRVRSVIQTPDGGYIAVGESYSSDGDLTTNNGDTDGWVLKLNNTGEIEWEKSFGGSREDGFFRVLSNSDGGYIVAGFSRVADGDVSYNHGGADCWVVKLTHNGELEWEKSYGGSLNDAIYDMVPSPDGGFVFMAYSNSDDGDVSGNQGELDIWVVKIDSSGNIEWEKTYGGSKIDVGHEIKATSDGGYIFFGYSNSADGDISYHYGYPENHNYWVVKIDHTGEIEWEKSFGDEYGHNGNSIVQTADDGYILAGSFGIYYGAPPNISYKIIKLNVNGETEWIESYGGSERDIPKKILITEDGGYIMVGQSESEDGDLPGNYGGYDAWILKLFPEQASVVDYNSVDVIAYPNPAKNRIWLTQPGVDLTFWDLTGKLVLKAESGDSFDVSKLTDGIYLLVGKTLEGKEFSTRFIKK